MSNKKKFGNYAQDGFWGFSKQQIIAISASCAVVAILLIILLVKLLGGNDKEAVVPTEEVLQQTTTSVSTEPSETTKETETELTEAADETEITTPETETVAEETEETTSKQETSNKNQNQNKPSSGNNTSKPSGSGNGSGTKPNQSQNTTLKLPYKIEDYDLEIQKVAEYDGVYLEDGTNQDASDVAMMLLRNTGSKAVEYAQITLHYGNKTLVFKASAVPAGGKVVVQAEDRAKMVSGDLTKCEVNVATRDILEMSESSVSVVENENSTLTVKNLTTEDIGTVRVFYKYYMSDDAVYVGGITYTAKITNLKAGESITIRPSHYVTGSSKVIMVRTYEGNA